MAEQDVARDAVEGQAQQQAERVRRVLANPRRTRRA